MELKYEDEADLQRTIRDILNKQGFAFEKTQSPEFCDLIDAVHKIYTEVKPETFAPAQLLYGLARHGIQDAEYVGLACAFEVRFYKVPASTQINQFARSIDPTLVLPPSAVNRADWNDQAFELLKMHTVIYTYQGPLDLSVKDNRIFITSDNLKYFEVVLNKYAINIDQFLQFISRLYAANQEIAINNEGRILNKNTVEKFENYDPQTHLKTDYKPIRDFRDRTLLESARIKSEQITPLLHQRDRSEPIHIRRGKGIFFTKDEVSKTAAALVNALHPDYIIEPYVGGGSLIKDLTATYAGVGNDIREEDINMLANDYGGTRWAFTHLNTITTPIADLKRLWHIPATGTLLILTNPPFGTGSTNALASRKGEVKKGESRTQLIEYGGLEKVYGKGDLVIPAVAKLIEILKERGSGYLAFFSPGGIFCGRERYNKLLKALLTDFEFLDGYIFSGEKFNSVATKKAIAFTVWKYEKNCNTRHESLSFNYEGNEKPLKKTLLLKDGWNYNQAIDGEIGTSRNDTFNNPNPKMIKLNLHNAGSQLIPENVKIDLHIQNVPSELIYGLWSITVGYKSIAGYPIFINDACIHLPDFTRSETLEILAYAVIHTLITEEKNDYCKGHVGFIGMTRVFQFGNASLTSGAQYLLTHCASSPIGSETIGSVFATLKGEPNIERLNPNTRKIIKAEIEKRLQAIGYWDAIPIPQKDISQPKRGGHSA